MRQIHGDDVAAEWLAGIEANEPLTYPKNSASWLPSGAAR